MRVIVIQFRIRVTVPASPPGPKPARAMAQRVVRVQHDPVHAVIRAGQQTPVPLGKVIAHPPAVVACGCLTRALLGGKLTMSDALIDMLARHQPDDTAVETGERKTSYKQLLNLTRAIREQIERSPVGPGPIVVADNPGPGACATIAAAQALGRAYVPLSASHPDTRIQQILAAVEPALIVQSDWTANRLVDVLPNRYPLLTISRQLSNLSWARSPEPEVNWASPIGSDIAYVMFTSGTTGRPKGVPVRVQSLMAYLDVATKRFGVQPCDRASHFFELTFDLSVHDIFVTLLGGGTLVVIPAEQRMLPARFLREKKISHWFSVPSAADSLHRVGALRPGVFPHLRQTLFCGEPLRWPVTEAWQAAAPNSRVINLYGPTEATIAISYYVVPQRKSSSNDLYGTLVVSPWVFDPPKCMKTPPNAYCNQRT